MVVPNTRTRASSVLVSRPTMNTPTVKTADKNDDERERGTIALTIMTSMNASELAPRRPCLVAPEANRRDRAPPPRIGTAGQWAEPAGHARSAETFITASAMVLKLLPPWRADQEHRAGVGAISASVGGVPAYFPPRIRPTDRAGQDKEDRFLLELRREVTPMITAARMAQTEIDARRGRRPPRRAEKRELADRSSRRGRRASAASQEDPRGRLRGRC
jgi:hypothetical protein